MSNKREEIQQEALGIALSHARVGLGISMGVGKTLIGLKYLAHLQENADYQLKALVVAPKLSIFDTWHDDAQKFAIDSRVTDQCEFTTYLSITKKNPADYDVVVLDECHSLLTSHAAFLGPFKGRILGLSGTPPRFGNSEKGRMVALYCPVKYKYITDDAVDDQILNDYRIFVHKMPLGTENTIPVNMKTQTFWTSERKSYDYWTKRIAEAQTKKQEQISSVMRMRVLMDFKTKEKFAMHLMREVDEKLIVFCNTMDQADRLCEYSYHSNNPESEENLQSFKTGEIDKLSCVMQLNEGVNIPNLKAGIILHAYGNERKSSQRIGRLLRLNPDDTAYVHILCYSGTVDERWVSEALKDLDQTKIKYFDANANTYEQAF